MTSDFAEIHDELRSVARDLLGKNLDWQQVVDAGWLSLEIPESLGGAGASFVETAILLEEMGRAAAPSRFLGTTLSVGALMALSPNESRDALLARIAEGATTAFAAGFTIRRGDGGPRLSGRAEFVPDAEGAEHLLLLAHDAEGRPAIVTAADVTLNSQPVLDETRSLAVIVADDVAITESWPLEGDPGTTAQRLDDRAAVAIACDSLGVAEAMLAATVEYAKVRHQFERPIGSFQAVKHACADMLVATSVTRQLVDAAVSELAAGRDASVEVAMAKSYASGAAVDVVGKAMQLHGGVGYTWESGVHVYLKRAALNRALFGSPASHRRRLAARYG